MENWFKSDYSIVKKLILEILDKEKLDNRPRIYIEDYYNTLRRYVVEDEEIRKICEEIYQKHKLALDLIYDTIHNLKNLLSKEILKYLKNSEEKLNIKVSNDSTSTYIRFLPNELSELVSGKGSNVWVKEEWLLLFELTIKKEGPITIRIVIGPPKEGFKDEEENLFKYLTDNKKSYLKFKGSKLYYNYKTIDTETIMKEDLSQISYDDSIMDIFKENLDKYFSNILPEKINAIKGFFLKSEKHEHQ